MINGSKCRKTIRDARESKKMTCMHVFPMKILLVDLIQSDSIMIAPTTAQPCIDKFQLIKLAEKSNKQKSIKKTE